MSEELKPCPFCGAGAFDIREHRHAPTMDGRPRDPISVELLHWCQASPGVIAAVIHFRARDRASVVAAWNRRETKGG